MLINVNKISENGMAVKDSVEIDGNLLLESESHFLEELNYQVFLQREENRIKAQGRIQTAISIPCGRCLEDFELKINSRFDIILFSLDMLDPKDSGNLNPDEMEYIFYEGDQIDLEKILIEQINLFIPLYPLCNEDCLGICPNCGTNLNQTQCPCDPPVEQIKFSIEKLKR